MPLASILIFDADGEARASAARELRLAGHDVVESDQLTDALGLLTRQRFALVLLDITALDRGASQLLSDLKASERYAGLRVVALSAYSTDAAEALREGADDFLAKPYSADELLARVGLCLRRRPVGTRSPGPHKAGRITIDDTSHRVVIDRTPIDTAPREYELLRFLVSHPGRVYTRDQLLQFVWHRARRLGSRTVDVHVRRLRALLEPFGCDQYLQTIRGVGYRFDPAVTSAVAPAAVTKLSHQ